jgi:hypothetical protein
LEQRRWIRFDADWRAIPQNEATEDEIRHPMNEHLQRALIEIYYAIAEFKQGHAETADRLGETDEVRARLMVVKSNLERLIDLPDGRAAVNRQFA